MEEWLNLTLRCTRFYVPTSCHYKVLEWILTYVGMLEKCKKDLKLNLTIAHVAHETHAETGNSTYAFHPLHTRCSNSHFALALFFFKRIPLQ